MFFFPEAHHSQSIYIYIHIGFEATLKWQHIVEFQNPSDDWLATLTLPLFCGFCPCILHSRFYFPNPPSIEVRWKKRGHTTSTSLKSGLVRSYSQRWEDDMIQCYPSWMLCKWCLQKVLMPFHRIDRDKIHDTYEQMQETRQRQSLLGFPLQPTWQHLWQLSTLHPSIPQRFLEQPQWNYFFLKPYP